jgi:hypothetical protein
MNEEAVKRYVYRHIATYVNELTSDVTQSPSSVEEFDEAGPGANGIPFVITSNFGPSPPL